MELKPSRTTAWCAIGANRASATRRTLEFRMKIILLILTVVIFCSGCAGLVTRELDCQFRVPIEHRFNTFDHIALESSSAGLSMPIIYCDFETNAPNLVYTFRPLIFISWRRVIYVQLAGQHQDGQYFVLDIPMIPRCSDWSGWRKPDYNGDPDKDWGGSAFYKRTTTNTVESPNNLELRFRVTRPN